MKVPLRAPLPSAFDMFDWSEWHRRFVLVGEERHQWVAPNDILVRVLEVNTRFKMKRSQVTSRLELSVGETRLEWDAMSLSSDAYATRYMRLSEDVLPIVDGEGGVDPNRLLALQERVEEPLLLHFALSVPRDTKLVLHVTDLGPPDIAAVTLHGFQRRPVL